MGTAIIYQPHTHNSCVGFNKGRCTMDKNYIVEQLSELAAEDNIPADL